jgi:hypothetical protein
MFAEGKSLHRAEVFDAVKLFPTFPPQNESLKIYGCQSCSETLKLCTKAAKIWAALVQAVKSERSVYQNAD